MNHKMLSIAIPTYNRAEYLDKLLDSIIHQLNEQNRDKIEITVSDNASTDNTDEVIEKYKDKVKIVYNKNPENLGADKNFLKCVELASGEYTVIFGSDDLLSDGAIDYILEELKSDNEIYLADRFVADINMQNPKEQHFTNYPRKKQVYDFKNDNDLIDYFNSVNTLAGVFSYLSSIIFKKSSWDAVKYDEKYTGTAYSHVFILLSFIKQKKCKLQYLEKSLPIARIGNDSFLENKNVIKRFLLDYNGYIMLANDLFCDKIELKQAFLNILKREHPFFSVMAALVMSEATKKDWEQLCTILNIISYTKIEKFIIKNFNFFGRVHYVILYIYKVIQKKKRPNLMNIFRKNICYFSN